MSRSRDGHVVDDALADPEHALGDLLEPGDHPQRGRLAAAGRADEHHELPVADRRGSGRRRHACRPDRPCRPRRTSLPPCVRRDSYRPSLTVRVQTDSHRSARRNITTAAAATASEVRRRATARAPSRRPARRRTARAASRNPVSAGGVDGEPAERVLVERLERERPRGEAADPAQRVRGERLADLAEQPRDEPGAEEHEHRDPVRRRGEQHRAEQRERGDHDDRDGELHAGHDEPVRPPAAGRAR